MIRIEQYIDPSGRSPFERWLDRLEPVTQARIIEALDRLEQGNDSVLKGVGRGVHELRLHFGPGFRIYCGRDGMALVILLGGGTKSRQQTDIEGAQRLWLEYKSRKQSAR